MWKIFITTGQYDRLAGTDQHDNIEEELSVSNCVNVGKEEKPGSDYVSQKKRSSKYQVAAWPPVGQLFIVIYGDRGKTGSLPLMSDEAGDKEKFLPGSVDIFKVISTHAFAIHFTTKT